MEGGGWGQNQENRFCALALEQIFMGENLHVCG